MTFVTHIKTVRLRTSYRPTSAAHFDASHSDHLSLSSGDVMQVAMSGHLLMPGNDEPDPNNELRRRVTTTNDDTVQQDGDHDEDFDDGQDGQDGTLVAGSSLEQYFDRQFHTFADSVLPAVDWSLRSFHDDDDEVPTL